MIGHHCSELHFFDPHTSPLYLSGIPSCALSFFCFFYRAILVFLFPCVFSPLPFEKCAHLTYKKNFSFLLLYASPLPYLSLNPDFRLPPQASFFRHIPNVYPKHFFYVLPLFLVLSFLSRVLLYVISVMFRPFLPSLIIRRMFALPCFIPFPYLTCLPLFLY